MFRQPPADFNTIRILFALEAENFEQGRVPQNRLGRGGIDDGGQIRFKGGPTVLFAKRRERLVELNLAVLRHHLSQEPADQLGVVQLL